MRESGSLSVKKRVLLAVAAWLVWAVCVRAQAVPDAAPNPVTSDQQSSTLSLPDFQSLLKQYEEQLARADQDPVAAGELRKSLPEKWTVKVDSQSVEISSEELRRDSAQMQRGGEEGRAAAQRAKSWLSRTNEEAEALGTGKRSMEAEREQRELAKVFSRTEFRGLNGPSWMDQWGARISRWLEQQVDRIFSAIHLPTRFGRVLIWPVLAIAIGVLAFLVWRVLRDQPAAALPEVVQEAPVNDRPWLKEAMAAAQRGEYREAVHSGYWAAIARLEQRQLLTSDRTRTPRESVRLLESHPSERGILREQTVRLERIWYGCREATASDWTAALAELRQIGCL